MMYMKESKIPSCCDTGYPVDAGDNGASTIVHEV